MRTERENFIHGFAHNRNISGAGKPITTRSEKAPDLGQADLGQADLGQASKFIQGSADLCRAQTELGTEADLGRTKAELGTEAEKIAAEKGEQIAEDDAERTAEAEHSSTAGSVSWAFGPALCFGIWIFSSSSCLMSLEAA